MFRLGYNTNGFAHHRLEDAVGIIEELGYRSIAVTLERDLLDPPDGRGVANAVRRLTAALRRRDLALTIETGARFILDARRKHQPTLISKDSAARRVRVEFLQAAIDIAAACDAENVSLWSGIADDGASEHELISRLLSSLEELVGYAERANVRLGFEPEPGMFVDTMARFAELQERVRHPLFGLTLDVGHIVCLGDGDIREHVVRWKDELWNVHLEDMRRGIHEHLMFGEGEVDFAALFAALRDVEYAGPVNVELSRHSHNAVEVARQAFEFLKQYA